MTSAAEGNNATMRQATLNMPSSDPHTSPNATYREVNTNHPACANPVIDDGKTLQREAIDSARAAGFAVLTATVMLVGILSGIGVVLIG